MNSSKVGTTIRRWSRNIVAIRCQWSCLGLVKDSICGAYTHAWDKDEIVWTHNKDGRGEDSKKINGYEGRDGETDNSKCASERIRVQDDDGMERPEIKSCLLSDSSELFFIACEHATDTSKLD
uniref:Uncharacterized protein n=1 Tax=Timema cristinae TaxID=61476 RepID=A0A7R9D407_TIMCR|nr:unnamed protein product [Timema cristinae]